MPYTHTTFHSYYAMDSAEHTETSGSKCHRYSQLLRYCTILHSLFYFHNLLQNVSLLLLSLVSINHHPSSAFCLSVSASYVARLAFRNSSTDGVHVRHVACLKTLILVANKAHRVLPIPEVSA